MLLEALEILQSAGEDVSMYVTDFAVYKVINILTVYVPLFVATFLLSQELLGEKIACFAPENFTDGQAGALNEYCWNNGFWVGPHVALTKSLFTQPHRYYAFYLAIQAVFCMSPIILWNVATKSRLLAVLRGTEEFLEDLVRLIMEGRDEMHPADLAVKVKGQLRQFHQICYSAASDSNLSAVLIARQVWELVLFVSLLLLQLIIYDFQSVKDFSCQIPALTTERVMCTVPVLDLLDFIWTLNVVALAVAMAIMVILVQGELRSHFGKYQPMFINDLPYGDQDDFNERVQWENNSTKHSYELLTMIYEENSTIMTQVYVLHALKPSLPEVDTDTDTSDDEARVDKDTVSSNEDDEGEIENVTGSFEVEETSLDKDVNETSFDKDIKETSSDKEVNETCLDKDVKETSLDKDVKETSLDKDVKETSLDKSRVLH